MRADRTIIVIGVFLVLIGLAAAFHGYAYVEVERGWSMLIAGTIGFCTGLLLAALGLVLHQLEDIASSASKAALMLAKARGGGLPEIVAPAAPASAPIARKEDEDVDSRPVRSAPVAPMASDADWEPEWEFEQAFAEEAEKTVAAERAAKALESGEASEEAAERPLSWTVRKDREDARPRESEPVEAEPVAQGKPGPAAEEWLFRTMAGPVAGMREPEPAEPHSEEFPSAAAPAPEPGEPAPEHEAAPGRDEKDAVEPHGADPADHAEARRPEVIGHYEAQGAHYVMYADGSIDAETVHGVYRFASMEELKQFIEGQE